MEKEPQMHSNPTSVYQQVVDLLKMNMSLKDACKQIGKRLGKTEKAVKCIFYRQGGNKIKDHGQCILTKQQSNILQSILIVYSLLYIPLEMANIRNESKILFNLTLTYNSTSRFIKKFKNELKIKSKVIG